MRTWWGIILVALGGAVGALVRHGSNELFKRWSLTTIGRLVPLSTLLVNVVGCFAIGVLMAFVRRGQLSEEWRLFFVTGILGALTTFSAFSFETVMLARDDSMGLAALNLLANVAISLFATWIGWRLCFGAT